MGLASKLTRLFDFTAGQRAKANDVDAELNQLVAQHNNVVDDLATPTSTARIADAAVTTPKIADLNVTEGKLATGAVTAPKLADAAVTTAKLADANVTTGKLANAAVTTEKLADANITSAKLADSAVTAGKLAPDAVSTTRMADNTVTTAKLVDGNVTTPKIADGAITAPKLGDSSVTEGKLGTGAATTPKVADAAITTPKLADTSVTAAKLAGGAVTETKLDTGAVTTAKLADANVTTTKIADSAITLAKLDAALKQDTGSIATNARFILVEADVADHETRIDAIESATSTEHTQTESVKSLPTGTLDGVVGNFETRGLSLVNSVVNGDFSDGTTGWTGDGANISASSNILTVTGTGAAGYVVASHTRSSIKAGAKYFIKARVRVKNAACIELTMYYEAITYATIATIATPTIDQWYDIYLIFTASSDTTGLRIRHQYADAATANGKVMEVDGNAGVFAINMTALGIEDYTEAQMLDLVRGGYFDGLKGVENAEVKTVGKNLFDKNNVKAGEFIILTTGAKSANALYGWIYIPVKEGMSYKVRNFVSPNTSWFASTSSGQITGSISGPAPAGAKYLGITILLAEVDTAQVELGTVATAYEPHKSSHLTITPTLRSLPNGVHDRVYEADGQVWLEKRVAEKVLVAGDIAGLTTTLTNVDFMQVLPTVFPGIVVADATATGRLIVSGFVSEFSGSPATWDNTANVGKFAYDNDLSSSLLLFVAKGTYASLADAQAALAGTVIHYQLATPQLINLTAEGLTEGELQSFTNGTVYLDADAFHVPSASFDVPTNTGAVLNSLVESANAQAKAIESKASKEQEDWIEPTLLNGWTGTLLFRKNNFGEVEVIGSTGAGTLTVGTVIAKLPAGYGPSTARVAFHGYNVASGTVFAFLLIPAGDIILRQSGINAGDTIDFHVMYS